MSEPGTLGSAVDREFTLAQSLASVDLKKLCATLEELLQTPVRLLDDAGRLLEGESQAAPDASRLPVRGDLEPIGYLEAVAPEEHLRPAVHLLEMLIRSNTRYLMASEMHNEVIHEDYAELQRKHEALKRSEARYRELSRSLEARVKEQVQTIDEARRQLYLNEKLASVGQLAAGVAHEINNPVGFIKSNLGTALTYVQQLEAFARKLHDASEVEALRKTWQNEELDFVLQDFADLLRESEDGAERVARIVADLKGFSRVDHSAEEEEDINRIIQQVINVASSQIGGKAKVVLDAGELPRMRCQSGQLAQVFFNILMNAVQAMEHPGRVRFVTEQQGEAIVVRIEDDGPGMPDAVRARIFEPFYTTREVGQGSGLGLTVSNDIVKAHGGRIDVLSELGKGTTFTLYLPLKRE